MGRPIVRGVAPLYVNDANLAAALDIVCDPKDALLDTLDRSSFLVHCIALVVNHVCRFTHFCATAGASRRVALRCPGVSNAGGVI